jgi:hypothetical protein
VLCSVLAFAETGRGGQLGVKINDGKQIAFFYFDMGTSKQTNISRSALFSGDTVVATFFNNELGPPSGIPIASWSAGYTVEGGDTGVCPAGHGNLPFGS